MRTATLLALRQGLVYEGAGNFFRAVHPIPVLTRAVCEWIPESSQDQSRAAPLLFREDSFNPVTRIRRGRLYQRDGQQGGRSVPAENVHNYPFGPHVGVAAGQWDPDSWYNPYRPSSSRVPRTKLGSEVQLGDSGYETIWRVVQGERILTGDILFTLRAVSFLGAIPPLARQIESLQGNPVDAQPIQAALDQVVDAFHAQQPQPIVDVCRESVRVILAAWVGPEAAALDLGALIQKFPDDRHLIRNAASIVNRLHPRGKSAELERQVQDGKVLRRLVDEDAEASVHLIGLILRDIEWAAR